MPQTQLPLPWIEVRRGEAVLGRHEIEPDRPLIVGRTEQCALQVPHGSVSRQHAKVWADASGVFIEDLGSANGTFLDGQRLAAVTKLAHGQVIQVGQRTSSDPLLLYFEDPATRLLQEMGLVASPAAAAEPPPSRPQPGSQPATAPQPERAAPAARETAATAVPSSSTHASTEPAGLPPMPPAESEGAGPPPVDASSVVVARPRPWWLRPTSWLAGVGLLVALGLATAYLVAHFRPSSTAWRSVELRPAQVAPGDRLTLISPDLDADDALTVTLAGSSVSIVAQRDGAVELAVPELAEQGAGSYDLPLLVRVGTTPAFEGAVRYVVQPRIDAVDPITVAGGGRLAIRGAGFGSNQQAIEVRIGDETAEVLEVRPQQVTVQVPTLVRDGSREAAVRLRTAGFEITSPRPVTVTPRVPRPLVVAFRGTYRPDEGAFAITSQLGLAFMVPAATTDTSRLSSRLDALNQAMASVLELAPYEPSMRLRIRERSGRWTLEAARAGGNSNVTLFEWTTAELVAAIPTPDEIGPDAMASWLAGCFDQLVSVFGRGEAPATGSSAATTAFAKLLAANLEAGGDGRPEEADLDALDEGDRAALAELFLGIPRRYGSLSGTWRATLDDVFDPSGGGVIEIDFSLRQRGKSLSGSAAVKLRGSGLALSLPSVPASGTTQAGPPTRVRLSLVAGRPVGRLELSGELGGEEMRGTFTAGERTGNWTATRIGD